MNLPGKGYLATSGNMFGSHKWPVASVVGRGRDAAKHPAVHQTIFRKPGHTQPKVNSADAEKPCLDAFVWPVK